MAAVNGNVDGVFLEQRILFRQSRKIGSVSTLVRLLS